MGKVGRIACTVPPITLTIGSLVCLVFVMVGQLSYDNKPPYTSLGRNLYFLKADTSNLTADSQTVFDKVANVDSKIHLDNSFPDTSTGVASTEDLGDFYLVGLWSYCEGEKANAVEKVTYCSTPKPQFWFDPTDAWNLQFTPDNNLLGHGLQKALETYKDVVGWMTSAFVIATGLTATEFVASFFAISSRRWSLVAFVLSTASSILAIAAAATATTVYGALAGVFHTALESYNIQVATGTDMLLIVWLAAALRVVSVPFWLPSVCCCKA